MFQGAPAMKNVLGSNDPGSASSYCITHTINILYLPSYIRQIALILAMFVILFFHQYASHWWKIPFKMFRGRQSSWLWYYTHGMFNPGSKTNLFVRQTPAPEQWHMSLETADKCYLRHQLEERATTCMLLYTIKLITPFKFCRETENFERERRRKKIPLPLLIQ